MTTGRTHRKIFGVVFCLDKACTIDFFCTEFSKAFDLILKYMFMKKLE